MLIWFNTEQWAIIAISAVPPLKALRDRWFDGKQSNADRPELPGHDLVEKESGTIAVIVSDMSTNSGEHYKKQLNSTLR